MSRFPRCSILPFSAYASFLVAGLMMSSNAGTAMFVAAIAPAALLYIGIHNAGDSITYSVIRRAHKKHEAENQ